MPAKTSTLKKINSNLMQAHDLVGNNIVHRMFYHTSYKYNLKGRKTVIDSPDPPSAEGPNILWTLLAYKTKVGYGMSYFLAACDNESPSLRTENIASAIVSGLQDLSGPRSRKRRLWTRL